MVHTKEKKPGPQTIKIGVRQETRRKFDAIQKATRLSLVEIADLLADDYIEAKGIEVSRSRKAYQPRPSPRTTELAPAAPDSSAGR